MDLDALDRKRLAKSGLLGSAFWAIILTVALFAPWRERVKAELTYSSVKLTLSSPAQSASVVAPSAPSTESADSAATARSAAPNEPKSSPAPAATASAKATTATPARAATPAPKRAPASGGLGIPNFDTPIGSSNVSDSGAELEFSSDSTATAASSASSARRPAAVTAPEFEGTAASVTSPDRAARSASGTAGTRTATGSASGETSRALADIADQASGGSSASVGSSGTASASRAGSADSRASDATSIGAGQGSSLSALAFEGDSRRLLRPAVPAIDLPESLSRLIDSDRVVTVQFTVRADGSVPGALISFTPASILPVEVRDWLRREFSSWRFEKGKSDGQARFRYSIKVQ